MKFRSTGKTSAEMPFLDHLEELRWRILWSMLAVLLCSIGAFFAVTSLNVIGFLMLPIVPYLENGKLIFLGVTDPLFITFKLAIAIGLVVASPIVFYHVWSFLSPALLPRERRAIVPALYLGLVLFAGGVALAYMIALPFTIEFMMNFQVASLEPNITAGFYFSFVTKLLLAFGIMFEMPVAVLVLSALGLVTSGFLRAKRRYAIAILAIVAAMITPGDAVTATVILLGPLLVLYELSIGLARLVERGRARAAAADAAEAAEETRDAMPEAL
jgi:sec-independent protein translocase protein TatC